VARTISSSYPIRTPIAVPLEKFFPIVSQVSENGRTLHSYWTTKCDACPLKTKCTTSKERRVRRWEHESVIEAMQQLDAGNAMTIR
jgi:hypothetical protein